MANQSWTEELCHIRCISCGRLLADKWPRYQKLLSQGVPIEEALDIVLGDKKDKEGRRIFQTQSKYCCRMRLMNPFKVVSNIPKNDQEGGIRNILVDESDLSSSAASTPSAGVIEPLHALRQASTPSLRLPAQRPGAGLGQGFAIIPNNPVAEVGPAGGMMELPDIPDIPETMLLPLTGVAPVASQTRGRMYQAW